MLPRTARPASLVAFALVLFCFFLPFTRLSCQGQQIATMTGVQLAMGRTIQDQTVRGEIAAVIAAAAALGGLLASVSRPIRRPLERLIASAVGALSLLFLKARLDNQVLSRGEGVLTIHYLFPYWLAFCLFASVGVMNWLALRSSPRAAAEDPQAAPMREETSRRTDMGGSSQ